MPLAALAEINQMKMKISALHSKLSNGIRDRTSIFREAKDILNEINALNILLSEAIEKYSSTK